MNYDDDNSFRFDKIKPIWVKPNQPGIVPLPKFPDSPKWPVPLIPSPLNPDPYPPNPIVGKCSQCGIPLHQIMGYCCFNQHCPTGLGSPWCCNK